MRAAGLPALQQGGSRPKVPALHIGKPSPELHGAAQLHHGSRGIQAAGGKRSAILSKLEVQPRAVAGIAFGIGQKLRPLSLKHA